MVSPTYAAIARRREEQGMLDTCKIVEVGARGVDPDPLTGLPPASETPIYSGPCEFVAANTQARSENTAGRRVVEQGAVLKLPVDAPGSDLVRPGHVATITIAAFDDRVLVVRIAGTHEQTYAASRRLPVEEVTSVR